MDVLQVTINRGSWYLSFAWFQSRLIDFFFWSFVAVDACNTQVQFGLGWFADPPDASVGREELWSCPALVFLPLLFCVFDLVCSRMIIDAYSLCGVWGPWNNFFPIERLMQTGGWESFQEVASFGVVPRLKACACTPTYMQSIILQLKENFVSKYVHPV